VVGVAELLDPHVLPRHVVLAVRRRQHDRPRPGELEQHPLEGRQAGRVQVLNHLNDGGRVEALQPPVSVDQRAVDEADAVSGVLGSRGGSYGIGFLRY
jgi:hypothetical protein